MVGSSNTLGKIGGKLAVNRCYVLTADVTIYSFVFKRSISGKLLILVYINNAFNGSNKLIIADTIQYCLKSESVILISYPPPPPSPALLFFFLSTHCRLFLCISEFDGDMLAPTMGPTTCLLYLFYNCY